MQISKKKVDQQTKDYIYHTLFQLIADLNSSIEAKKFMQSFFTETELLNLAKRLAIAVYLENNASYEKIEEELKVSSATIANVEKIRKEKGFQLAIDKIRTERWAEEWAKKITKTVDKIVKRDK